MPSDSFKDYNQSEVPSVHGGSVTTWIGELRDGSHAAAQKLWERYFDQLVRLARSRLTGLSRTAVDEEDVAAIAFQSFCEAAQARRFPKLNDRYDLWQVLVMLTARKALDERRYQTRSKRSSGSFPLQNAELEEITGNEPDPAFAMMVAEQLERLLNALGDDELQLIARRKMEGFTNEVIAQELKVSVRTVQRSLSIIRTTWEELGERSD